MTEYFHLFVRNTEIVLRHRDAELPRYKVACVRVNGESVDLPAIFDDCNEPELRHLLEIALRETDPEMFEVALAARY